MFNRSINLPSKQSFFLFGARGTGKTSLLKAQNLKESVYIDLLNLDSESKYQLDPEVLYRELLALSNKTTTIIIDEIQKVPKLLDVVHRLIEEKRFRFILTGSSARKLKRGAANLLAGRASVFNLFPLLIEEIGSDVEIESLLQFGTLPTVVTAESNLERRRYLKAYAQTYLKEEVWGEQLIRKIEPFRKFLPLAAQMHGQPINFSKIARNTGVDDTTVRSYFSILEDTLLGTFLEAYSGSIRKQLRSAPKFYFFDIGVKRTLEDQIDFPLSRGSFEYGQAFETTMIHEIMRRVAYQEVGLRFAYLSTEGGAEIDLVISRGNKVIALVEIKSGSRLDIGDLRHIIAFQDTFKGAALYCLYQGKDSQIVEGVKVMPWESGLDEIVNTILPES